MRLLLAAVLAESVFALFFAGNPAALWLGPVALILATILIRREALVVAPLLLAIPALPLMLQSLPTRLLGVSLATALVLMALSDIAHRHKGAPLSFARLLLWYLSGAFMLLVGVFAAAADHILPPSLLLAAVLLLAGGSGWLARTSAERARAREEHRVPVLVDAIAIAVMATELIIALTFLPLAPIPLAGVAIVLLWLPIRIVVASRLEALTWTQLVGFCVYAAVLIGAVTLPALLFS